MKNVERESIILNSAWSMVDDMVNWAMFEKNDIARPTNLMFQTHVHARLFNILLGDFLSEVRAFKGSGVPFDLSAPPSNARPTDLTFILHLRHVCSNPTLGEDVASLRTAIESFANWLEGSFVAEGVNLANIGVVADMKVARYRYIKMCGDIAKHNLARLATNVEHLRRLLAASNHPISEQQAYLAVDDFFEWFHRDIFICHSSLVAEFLNNIRWEIFEYLRPEYRRAWRLSEDATPDFKAYTYDVPVTVADPIARAMYWDLMNRVRGGPWVRRFVTSDSLRLLY